jgi:hypothetical protein
MPLQSTDLIPELDNLRTQVEKIVTDARKLTVNISNNEFNWRPEPAKWSIAQCLAHLNINGALVMRAMEESIDAARAKGLTGKGPYGHSFLAKFLLGTVEPPVKRKFKAAQAITPPPDVRADETIPEFLALQDRLKETLRKANGVDLGRAKVPSPITSMWKITLGDSLALMTAHERRHLWQAWQVRNDPRFPAQ